MKVFFLLLFTMPFIAADKKIPARIGKKYTKPDIGLVTFALHEKHRLTKIDKQRVLDIHNALRNYLALGKETHSYDGQGGYTKMPEAADMQAMSWDDNLAKYAQNWADTKPGKTHSPLKNDPLLNAYSTGFLAESMSGDITAQERDMYGEVQFWNYDSFECQSGKQCGHYLAFANAQYNHLGCGYNQYKKDNEQHYTLVCVYGGNNPTSISDGETRKPWQHEYIKGSPCSKCQQGWDYCMGGGLCATKKQCESFSGNNCKCLHDQGSCESNGGTFNAAECTCTCPSGRMGINCGEACANTKADCPVCTSQGGSKYLCQKKCNSCGKAQSAAFKWAFGQSAPNSLGLMTRWQMEDPDNEAGRRTPKGQPYCKNSDVEGNCEKLKERGYCEDFMLKIMVKYSCKLSCNEKCKKPDTGPTDADFNNLLKGSGLNTGKSSSAIPAALAGLMKSGGNAGLNALGGLGNTPDKGSDAASALNALGMSGMAGGLGDLSGFKVARRRRR